MNFELKPDTDFIIAIDVSASMQTPDCHGLTRFNFATEKTKQFCKEASTVDEDGITLITFGHKIGIYSNVTDETVQEVISNLVPDECATKTDEAIHKAWQEHVINKNKHTILFVVTDGVPQNEKKVLEVCGHIYQVCDNPGEFGIVMLTVGHAGDDLLKFFGELEKLDIVQVEELENISFYGAVGKALGE